MSEWQTRESQGSDLPPSCRICGGHRIKAFRRRGATYHRCPDCEAVTKALTSREYDALGVTYDPDPLVAAESPSELRALLKVESKKAVLRPFLPRGHRRAEFLDIGCGQGGYLLAARELGCSVVGVEPSPEHSAAGREVFGLEIVRARFHPSLFDPGRFETVLLSHVIEHIFDPASFLQGVLSVVAPGGIILLVTPNAGSTVARLSGPHWPMLKTIDHVSLLSQRTFSRMRFPQGLGFRFRQSEFPWETPVSLAVAGRDALREKRQGGGGGIPSTTSLRRSQRQRRLGALLWLVAALMFPVHVFNRVRRRQACLIVEIRKPPPPPRRTGLDRATALPPPP